MLTSRSVVRAALSGTLALVGVAAAVTPALASATDAEQACGASQITSEQAYVPPAVHDSRFLSIHTTRGTFDLNCGNGKTWGAVHIELKHEVPNWADAATCISKAIGQRTEEDETGNKTKYIYRFTGGTVVVVRGARGIITAYPTGTGVVRKWALCSVS